MCWKLSLQPWELLENCGTSETPGHWGHVLKGTVRYFPIPSHEVSGFSLGVLITTGPQSVCFYKLLFISKVTVKKGNTWWMESLLCRHGDLSGSLSSHTASIQTYVPQCLAEGKTTESGRPLAR